MYANICDVKVYYRKTYELHNSYYEAGNILDMGSANERRRYYATHSLIGRAHVQTDPFSEVSSDTSPDHNL